MIFVCTGRDRRSQSPRQHGRSHPDYGNSRRHVLVLKKRSIQLLNIIPIGMDPLCRLLMIPDQMRHRSYKRRHRLRPILVQTHVRQSRLKRGCAHTSPGASFAEVAQIGVDFLRVPKFLLISWIRVLT